MDLITIIETLTKYIGNPAAIISLIAANIPTVVVIVLVVKFFGNTIADIVKYVIVAIILFFLYKYYMNGGFTYIYTIVNTLFS